MFKFIYSFGTILFGLLLGYAVQHLVKGNIIRLPVPMEDVRRRLQRIALLFVNPVSIVGAIWIVDIDNVRLIALPFVGLFALFMGGVFALGAAKLMHLDPCKTGSLFGCGAFTNIGSIGALTCFIFLGEPGFALVPIYRLFEEVSYYAVGFPIARYYGGVKETNGGPFGRLKDLFKDPFIIVAVSSLLVGGALNFSGWERPSFYRTLNGVLIPSAAILLLASIGMALELGRVRDYIRECVSVALIKFLLVPTAAVLAAYGFDLDDISGGLPLKVVIILSSMPVAFIALIPPSIYDLDLDLANSCWLATTAMLAIVLPILLVVTQAM